MNKSPLYLAITAVAVLTISACSSVSNKIADNSMQQKKLADGSPVSLAFNLPPTEKWGCQQVGTPQSYNWALLQTQGSLAFGGPPGVLTSKALDYANKQNLKTNYINMRIPTQFSVGGMPANPAAKATVTYYQCKLINPEKDFGTMKSVGFGGGY